MRNKSEDADWREIIELMYSIANLPEDEHTDENEKYVAINKLLVQYQKKYGSNIKSLVAQADFCHNLEVSIAKINKAWEVCVSCPKEKKYVLETMADHLIYLEEIKNKDFDDITKIWKGYLEAEKD